MTLPFKEEVINDGTINAWNFKYPHFIGYLSPQGVPISFEDKFGYTGHGEALSVQERFRVYYPLKIRDSELLNPLEKHIMRDEYKKSEKERYLEALKMISSTSKEKFERWYKNIPTMSPTSQMELDVYDFLLNCYSADTFFEGVGNVETCMCEEEFRKHEYKRNGSESFGDWDFNMEYRIYKDTILVDVFKNVMIQNLGYHSVERTPRTITTSSLQIYETFYNYLLNDFTIYQMPKMIFDPEKRKYVQQSPNEFFLPDSELRLKDEIQAIKKLVPLKDRARFYR